MSKVIVSKSKLDNLATSINDKSGTTGSKTIDEMSEAVSNIVDAQSFVQDNLITGINPPVLFNGNKNITEIPFEIDTSTNTSLAGLYQNCINLIDGKTLDCTSITTILDVCNGCTSLRNINIINSSILKDCGRAFRTCSSLVIAPTIDFTNTVYVGQMYHYCRNITSFQPLFNFQKVVGSNTNFLTDSDTTVSGLGRTFKGCSSIQHIGRIIAPLNKNLHGTFDSCSSLIDIEQLETTSAIRMQSTFYNCSELKSISVDYPMDWTNVTVTTTTFKGCSKLEEVRFVVGTIKYNVLFSDSPLLSVDSLNSIISGLYDYTGGTTHTLTLNSAVVLTEEQISAISNKNWTLVQ